MGWVLGCGREDNAGIYRPDHHGDPSSVFPFVLPCCWPMVTQASTLQSRLTLYVAAVHACGGDVAVAAQDGTAATLPLEDLIDDARLYDSDLDYSDDEAEGDDDLQGAGSGCSDMDEENAEEELQEEEQEVHGGLGLDVFAHAR